MTFLNYVGIEFQKVKRSRILPILLIAPLLVVISGVSSLAMYLTPEYPNPWAAMFIQSSLLFGFYLLPLSMVVVCVMISHRETQSNGILKMLALPIDISKMAVAKFFVLAIFLFIEILIFLVTFIIAGLYAMHSAQIDAVVPISYLVKWCVGLFVTSLPAIAVMWAITVYFEKPLLSIGLNFLLIVPGVLVGVTPLWVAYPYCYSGQLVSSALHSISTAADEDVFELFPFLLCAIIIFVLGIFISVKFFGRRERR